MKLNKLMIATLAGFSMFFASCENADENEQHYDNKVFISGSSFTQETFFKSGDTSVKYNLTVAIAKPEEHDIKVTMEPAPELLPTYHRHITTRQPSFACRALFNARICHYH